MPDLADLLDRTTPRNLAPPDLAAIAGRADRRRRQRRQLPLVAALVVLAVGAGSIALGAGDDGPQELASAANPWGGDELLTEPVGTWVEAAEPPFGRRTPSLTGTLSDGRVLVWGGQEMADRPPLDGGIYDPTTDSWTPIAPAPLPPFEPQTVALAQDRLLVLATVNSFFLGAVYDVATDAWTELPQPIDVLALVDAAAWTGDTLAIVRTNPGGIGYAPNDDIDWRVDAPVTLRWHFGDAAWTEGTPFPLGLRSHGGVAFDGQRLAVVGGTTRNVAMTEVPPGPPPGRDPGLVTDGAIYDVDADSWIVLPPTPSDAVINAESAWLDDGRLLVGGGTNSFSSDWEAGWPGPFVYDPATATWDQLPAAPELNRPNVTWRRYSYVVGQPTLLTASPTVSPDRRQRYLYTTTGWELAPQYDLRVVGPAIVATSGTANDPDDGPFRVSVRVGTGLWLPAVEAPFGNRADVGIAVIGDDSLLFVGGDQGRYLESQGGAWILDLNP